MRYTVTTTKCDNLGLHEFAERVLAGMWVPDHLTLEEAAAFAVEAFREAMADELQSLVVTCEPESDSCLHVAPPA